MFHVKQKFEELKKIPITHLVFFLFILSIPFQLRLILNFSDTYIDSIFIYHKAIFFYLSDLLFICFIFSAFIFGKFRPKWWVILPFVYCLILLFHVEQFDLGIYFSLKVLEFFLIIAYIAANPSLFWTTAKLLVVSGIFQGLISIIQFETQSGMGLKLLGEYFPPANEAGASTLNTEPKLTRAYGTFPHPNVLGGFLSLVLAIFLYVSRETKSKIGFLIVSCGTIVLLWGIVVSFSRSAMLAAAVTLALFIIHLFVQKSYKKALYWTILTIVSCGTLALTYSEFIVPRTTETVSDNPAFSYRRQFNGMGLEIFRENPIFGVGPGQYTTAQESEYTLESWEHQPPHNIFIYLMATMGIFGLILAIFTYYKLGFTWNNQVHWLSIVLLAQVFILGNVDHYLVTIQQGILMFAIVLSFILINKIDVSQPRETSIK